MVTVLAAFLSCAASTSAATVVRGKYGAGAHESFAAFLPSGPARAPRPTVLFFHSHTGGPRELANAARMLAEQGAVAVLADYDVNGRWPKPPKEARRAYRYVRARSLRWSLDRARFAVVGASQGATLALQLGFGRYAENPVAVVSWSGVSNYAKAPAIVGSEMGCPLAACPQAWVDASAALLPAARSLRGVQVVNGTRELVPTSQARELDAHVAQLGLGHELTLWPCSCHGAAYAVRQWQLTDAFLRMQLGF